MPSAAAPDTTETVLEHAEGIKQLAVATPTEDEQVATQLLAGVRTVNGTPTAWSWRRRQTRAATRGLSCSCRSR